MDTGRFDAWTRRRFGLGVSGLAAGLLGVASGGEALAKKKKKKCKKCEKCEDPPTPCNGACNQLNETCIEDECCRIPRQACTPGGTPCCLGLTCQSFPGAPVSTCETGGAVSRREGMFGDDRGRTLAARVAWDSARTTHFPP